MPDLACLARIHNIPYLVCGVVTFLEEIQVQLDELQPSLAAQGLAYGHV